MLTSKKKRFFFILIAKLLHIVTVNAASERRNCIQYSEIGTKYDSEQEDDDSDYSSALSEVNDEANNNNIVECPTDFIYCFNIWRSEANGTKKIVKRGCWQDSSEVNTNCNQEECVGTSQTPPNANLYFCCCSGNSCNKNMIEDNSTKTEKELLLNGTQSFVVAENTMIWMSPIFLSMISFISFLIVLIACFVTCRQPVTTGPETAPLSPSGPGYSSNLQNVDNLTVISMLGQGKYGTVWKGLVNEQPVAVKIFPAHHKQYYINERNIYSLPLMDNPSILSYYGCDERTTLDDSVEHFLVLSLAPLGCVQDWLVHNTAEYEVFCNMAKSICRGVSHLHTELQRGDDLKPCVCHRDLNTRNILVKSDLTCCIADFGFALKTFGCRYEYKGEMALAETKSLAEVGTLRYMAPEILEGAVNLRDCETALKQIDVYSLGLIIWELSTRCQDFYAAQTVPDYKAPYENEVGMNPSFEQMQVLVARHKARPLFPTGWGGSGPAGKLIKDTCEDCWDHDAEARLTALCAEERVHELINLRPKSHTNRGPSPPISANNLLSNTNFRSISMNSTISPETGVVLLPPPNQMIPRIRTCSETGSTIINMCGSPSGGIEKNHIMLTQQIQPYQGRNPCQERNLAAPSTRQNQVLVEKSKKHSFLDHNGLENNLSCLEDDVSVEDLISNNTHHTIIEESSILGEGFPKQNNTDKKLKGWYGVRALIQKKLFRKQSLNVSPSTVEDQLYKNNSPKCNYIDENTNLVENRLVNCIVASPTKDLTVNFVDGRNRYQNGIGNVQTILENGHQNVIVSNRRPSNLDLVPITVRVNGLSPENNKSNLIRNLHNDERKFNNNTLIQQQNDVLKMMKNNQNDLPPPNIIKKEQPRLVISRSANAVKNLNNSAATIEDGKITRQRSLEMFKEVFSGKGSTERLRDPSQRVKTPGDIPPSVRKVRASKTLSLYDDRLMSSAGLNIL